MKLEDMADLLEGLASSLEKFLGKTTMTDLRTVSACLRQFPGESVSSFCNFVARAKEGKAPSGRTVGGFDQAKVDQAASEIKHFLDHRQDSDYAAIHRMLEPLEKLKVEEIKQVGRRIEWTPVGRTKADLLRNLKNWVLNIKRSADQTSFSLTGTGVS